MKRIIHGVTGSIAACKAAELTSLLVKAGYEVSVVMTGDALRFIAPLPFKTLSRHPVVTDLYDETEGWKPSHIELADAADLLLIAPATANTIAKLAHGLADDALGCIALALQPGAKLLIAPAMNGKMWLHPATQQNVATLKKRGAEFIGPDKGMLSCGYEGLAMAGAIDRPASFGQSSITPRRDVLGFQDTYQKLARLLAAPTIEPSQRAARIQSVEKDIILPLRVLVLAILFYFLFLSGWEDVPGKPRDMGHSCIKIFFWFYLVLNLGAGAAFIWVQPMTLRMTQWLTFCVGFLDVLLMTGLTFITDGWDSEFYWIFAVLILHNALAIPLAFPQILLNFLTVAGFILGGLLDHQLIAVIAVDSTMEPRNESVYERVIVLLIWAACCYGIQVLFERQRRAEAEATEFAVRQERLRTAGRLAAEIAHKIKNPLGIITNAAYCLPRAVEEGAFAVEEQVSIIREEVEKADQILTELMGYAQLAEGRVERLNLAQELDEAILQVFPSGSKYNVAIRRDYSKELPPVLMQKQHLSIILVNLLQNAREALHGVGEIVLTTCYGEQDSIVISIADNGPGIPSDKIDKIFEAYFTTRAKGTGLGLAIVKHNTEMYGGVVRVQSEPGTGSCFILEFPARIMMRLTP